MNYLLDPFKAKDPKAAALLSGLQTAVVLALAAFLINLTTALTVAANDPAHAFSFDWRVQAYMLGAAVLGALGKGLLAFIGATNSPAIPPIAPPPADPLKGP